MCRFFNIMSDNFSNISDIIGDNFFDSKKAQIALKHSTIFSFWGQIVGKKFINSSKPMSIRNFKLYVSCENSFVVQELMMYKKVLLKKLLPYSSALGVEISDILFEYKNWNPNREMFQAGDDFPEFYSNDELSKVNIDLKAFEHVFKNIENSTYLNEEQKEKFKNKIIKLQQAKKMRFL